MTTGWLNIGKVGKAHGLRGAFFVRGRDDLIPKSYATVRIGSDPSRAKPGKITMSRWQGNAPVLAIDSVTDRNMADAIVGQDIWVERDSVSVDHEEEFLWDDLVGRTLEDRDGVAVGKVTDIYNTGAADIAVVEHDTRGTLEIALVADYFDLDFEETGPLKLVVAGSMFDELWQEGE